MSVVVLCVAGCGTPRFDATNEETAKASIEAMTREMSDEQKKEFMVASMKLADVGLPSLLVSAMTGTSPSASKMFKPLHGLTVKEILSRAASAAKKQEEDSENELRKQRIEASYQLLDRYETKRAIKPVKDILGPPPFLAEIANKARYHMSERILDAGHWDDIFGVQIDPYDGHLIVRMSVTFSRLQRGIRSQVEGWMQETWQTTEYVQQHGFSGKSEFDLLVYDRDYPFLPEERSRYSE
jgi:hypothetical protein